MQIASLRTSLARWSRFPGRAQRRKESRARWPISEPNLQSIAEAIDQCRASGGCGFPPCGPHAVGKPAHQSDDGGGIMVVGESPAPDGWWATGRAFYRPIAGGGTVLSRTGANLNDCLAALHATVDTIDFVEAVKCRDDRD